MNRALIILLLAVSSSNAEEVETLFVRRVWPLFQEKCLACHGNDEKKIKGGLDMRSLASTLKGGDSEEKGLVPGKASDSPLYLAVTRTHDDWKPMPPKEADKLTQEQTAWIKSWIDGGATWPDDAKRSAITRASADKWSAEDGVAVKTSGGLNGDWSNRKYKPENLWAYQPMAEVGLRMADSKPNPIDVLIAKRMSEGVKPAPPADARAFIRRATFDLTGLPPTPEEIAAFEADSIRNAPSAIRHLIERLLESPHYGEQWGRHWLDVVRYADSSGFSNDYERGNAWRYRDYVIRSFNEDKPYDRFIIEQIAGDELLEERMKAEGGRMKAGQNFHSSSFIPHPSDALIAPGFLRMGPWELTGMEVAKIARQRFLDDVTNSVGEVFLAHSLQCARCHDHKFDPIPTQDYYAMQACFATTQLAERPAAFLPTENTNGFEEKRYLDMKRADFIATLKQIDEKTLKATDAWFSEKKLDRSAWDAAVKQARKGEGKAKGRGATSIFEAARGILAKQGVAEDAYPPKQLGFTTQEYGMERIARKGLERLQWELDRYQPVAFSVYDGRTVDMKAVISPMRMPENRMTAGELEQVAVLAGGDPFSPTKPVDPGVLSVVSALNPALPATKPPTEITGRRLALAEWIASKKNPLTARVMMNRVWLWHFGQPLAGNPNNFGSTGKKPSHPELLDWLAATFIEKGWSLKEMHRVIMTSEAYRRGSAQEEGASITRARGLSDDAETDKSVRAPLSREDLEASYAVFKPRRLTAEEMRDAMLLSSGELNRKLGGIPARPEINLEAAMQPRQVMGTFAAAWEPSPRPEDRHRRSVYALKIRGLRDPFMEVFNEPAPDFSCERRDASSVTPQVFSLFNGKASYDRALALAARVMKETKGRDLPSAIELAFRLALGRQPLSTEAEATLAHWQDTTAKHEKLKLEKPKAPQSVVRDAVEENTGEKFSFTEPLHAYRDFIPDLQPGDVDARTRALADVCLVLFNSNEFAYIY